MCLTGGFDCGVSGKLKTDFRVWLKVDKLLKSEIKMQDKMIAVLGLVYTSLPQSIEEALKEIADFYSGTKKKEKSTSKRMFDFEYDGELILAAFRQQYGINLLKENLHWHEFLALLRGLTADTLFVRTINVRSADLSEIKDKEKRKKLLYLKRMCALPLTEKEERENEELINKLISRRQEI
ncbi:MAG: hypothetical protein J6L59_02925 [Clostridia bacterium]|nr:hypothetical protein [Clostridia bacterium]